MKEEKKELTYFDRAELERKWKVLEQNNNEEEAIILATEEDGIYREWSYVLDGGKKVKNKYGAYLMVRKKRKK